MHVQYGGKSEVKQPDGKIHVTISGKAIFTGGDD